MPRPSGAPDEAQRIIDSVNAGAILPPVTFAELMQAWAIFRGGCEQAARTYKLSEVTLLQRLGNCDEDKVPTLFMRCVLLSGLGDNHVEITEAMIRELAEMPLGLEETHTFLRRYVTG